MFGIYPVSFLSFLSAFYRKILIFVTKVFVVDRYVNFSNVIIYEKVDWNQLSFLIERFKA